MLANQMVRVHILQRLQHCLILLGIVVTQAACSSITNTIAELTTPQSTISGSTYPFWVTKEGRLSGEPQQDGKSIGPGDYFTVSLDFGSLRYLQAVDPYVIVYSETWMSSSPKPIENEKTLRQVVLLKEGVSQNARLPVTAVPILGPVTYGEDSPEVHVTVKVVVLSKYDNASAIQIVEGLAGIAGAAAPQYAVAAGAAADSVAAFIKQNRDKIEFEHTFTFSPTGKEWERSPTAQFNNESGTLLKTGRLVVLKGEDAFRVVPYHTWYYYLIPFNWWGTYTSKASRKWEQDELPRYQGIGAIIRIPVQVVL